MEEDNSLRLHTLISEYELLIDMYKHTYNTLLADLSEAQTTGTRPFKEIQGAIWNGTADLSTTQDVDQAKCESMCAADLKCTGATFENNMCMMKTGYSPLTDAQVETTTALLPKIYFDLEAMRKLSEKMEKLDAEIKRLIAESATKDQSSIDEYTRLSKEKEVLQTAFTQLNVNQDRVYAEIRRIQTTNEQYNSSELVVDSNYFMYKVWIMLFCVILGLVVVTFSGGGPNGLVAIIIVLAIIYGLTQYVA